MTECIQALGIERRATRLLGSTCELGPAPVFSINCVDPKQGRQIAVLEGTRNQIRENSGDV